MLYLGVDLGGTNIKAALSEIFNYPRRILKSADMKGFQRYFLG